jgi:hypothetical protein
MCNGTMPVIIIIIDRYSMMTVIIYIVIITIVIIIIDTIRIAIAIGFIMTFMDIGIQMWSRHIDIPLWAIVIEARIRRPMWWWRQPCSGLTSMHTKSASVTVCHQESMQYICPENYPN